MADILKKIALFGPHDRFNYGDFLFPLMLQYAIKSRTTKTFEFEYYSIIDADYSASGAFKTKGFNTLKNNVNNNKISTIIVTGGECLNATWSKIYSFINPHYSNWINKSYYFRKFDAKYSLTKRFLGGLSEHPFAVSKADFKIPIKTFYHSVGGFRAASLSAYIEEADYLALRDEISFQSWQNAPIKSFLVPDSAIILSDVFPKDKIVASFTKFIRPSVVDMSAGKYVFFQVSNSKFKNEDALEEIAQQLDQINKSADHNLVLCPIGTAPGHEDDRALQKVADLMETKAVLVHNPTIYEILLLLSHTALFIGTSLHGVITAMSYNIPYIAIGKAQSKLKNYLDTWASERYNELYSTTNFMNAARQIWAQPNNEDDGELNRQKELYYSSVDRIVKIL